MSRVLLIHRSERADALVAALGAGLVQPPADPFATDIVAVPSKGVERWLAQQLSHVLGAGPDGDGVCANVAFPSYTQLLDEAAAVADEDYARSTQAWSAQRVVWPLMSVIDRCAPSEPWCRALAVHLGLDGTTDPDAVARLQSGRRFAVAVKLARYFESYGKARPAMLRAWAAGRDEQGDGSSLPPDLRWQSELWRRLRAELGIGAPAELLEQACARITDRAPLELPDRFAIFGATRISPSRIQVLAALAEHRDVHLYLQHPSPALWASVRAANVPPGRRRDQHTVVRNPLLASLARDVRELQHLVITAVPAAQDRHHPLPPRPHTLLGRLQGQLADDLPPTPEQLAEDDRSITVHACHGAPRQVEVVREIVLGLLADDPTLEPRDVLIMCPDVEQFAPLVAASFGMTNEPDGHPAAQLRVRLADRSLRQTNPLLSLLSRVLELAASRVTATQVLDLAGSPAVRRLFAFDDDDVERLRDWTAATNARWGLDAEHRRPYGLGGLAQGTWRAALDRLLLGVAMEEDVEHLGSVLPYDDVDSGDIDLAGRFAELLDRLDVAVRTLQQPHNVGAWMHLLAETVLGLGAPLQSWQAMQLHRELDAVAEVAGDTDVELNLMDVVAMLADRLAGRPGRASFRTGTLTVCTLVPMRSVPHRVVCLLGMDDGAFPRRAIADGDDVLARDPRTGERDPRSEDRQLFLDAICAAQEHLVVTYTGADPHTGAEIPPCVPLAELLDAVDASVLDRARDRIVVHHPLQPFDARNFVDGALGRPGPFSFDPCGLAGARAVIGPRQPPRPLVATPLVAPPSADTVDLEDLVRFLQHPARAFLRQRLGVSLFSRDTDPDDALSVALDGLPAWTVGEQVLHRCLGGTPREVAARLEYLRGGLPPGALGRRAMQTVGGVVDALLAACSDERSIGARAVDVAVPLPDGRTVTGTVGGVRGSTLLAVSYSRLAAKQRVAAWARYLALVAATGEAALRAVTVGRADDGAARSILRGVDPLEARRLLAELVALRDAGLREPLPMPVATAAAYAGARVRRRDQEQAVLAAGGAWEKGNFCERLDPEHTMVLGAAVPLAALVQAAPSGAERGWFPDEPSRFGALAMRLWVPLLEHESAAGS